MNAKRRMKIDVNLDATPSEATSAVASADMTATPIPSPAMQLQDQLERALAESDFEPRWSARRTLAFILLTCGGFWAALIYAILAGF